MPHYRSLSGAIVLLGLLQNQTDPAGARLTDLAHESGLDKGTTSRILDDLAEGELVNQDAGSGRFSLGIRLAELGSTVLQRFDLRREAHPILVELAGLSQETIHLAVPAGPSVIYLEKIESPGAIQTRSRVGDRMPITSTGLGKAMLAFMPDGVAERILADGIVRRTTATLTTPEELRRDLGRTRVRGYSIDLEENEEGIACVGAPVFNHDSLLIASVSIAGPAFRFGDHRIDELGRLVEKAAHRISRRMGAPPDGAAEPPRCGPVLDNSSEEVISPS